MIEVKVVLYGDGKHDDTEALEHLINGTANVITESGETIHTLPAGGRYETSRAIEIKKFAMIKRTFT